MHTPVRISSGQSQRLMSPRPSGCILVVLGFDKSNRLFNYEDECSSIGTYFGLKKLKWQSLIMLTVCLYETEK
jgi:hypothetical protein